VSQLEVQWPSGRTDRMLDIAADQTITIQEGTGIVAKKQFTRQALAPAKLAGKALR